MSLQNTPSLYSVQSYLIIVLRIANLNTSLILFLKNQEQNVQ